MKKLKQKKKSIKYISLTDVRCPICKGKINEKWFNFRSGNVVEFIAECYTPDYEKSRRDIENDKIFPRHVFYFQIETPDGLLVHDKRSKIFSGGNDKNK